MLNINDAVEFLRKFPSGCWLEVNTNSLLVMADQPVIGATLAATMDVDGTMVATAYGQLLISE